MYGGGFEGGDSLGKSYAMADTSCELSILQLTIIMLKAPIDRHFIAFDSIDQAMFFRDASAPEALESMLQRLGFADAFEWVGCDCRHKGVYLFRIVWPVFQRPSILSDGIIV